MSQQNESPKTAQPDSKRLPCRGCRSDCPNYERCEGKPWRMVAAAK